MLEAGEASLLAAPAPQQMMAAAVLQLADAWVPPIEAVPRADRLAFMLLALEDVRLPAEYAAAGDIMKHFAQCEVDALDRELAEGPPESLPAAWHNKWCSERLELREAAWARLMVVQP